MKPGRGLENGMNVAIMRRRRDVLVLGLIGHFSRPRSIDSTRWIRRPTALHPRKA
jgi:hypothetical protein